MIQVVQFLGNGMCTLRTVNTDGSILVGLDEVQVVVYRVIVATGNLRGHEIGKHLLGPYILEPLQ